MIVNETEFATFIGCSPRTVSNLIDKGLPAEGGTVQGVRWRIDSHLAMTSLLAHETNKRVVDAGGEVGDLTHARLNKLIEEHRGLKFDNDTEELRLLPADQVRLAFNAARVEFDALLDGAAERMARGDAALRQRLLDEHERIRNTFARRLAKFDPLPTPVCPD